MKRDNDHQNDDAHSGCPTCGYYHFTREEKMGMLNVALIFIGLGAFMGLLLGWILWGVGLD